MEWITENPADRNAGPHTKWSMDGRFRIEPNIGASWKRSGWNLFDTQDQPSWFRKLADAKAEAVLRSEGK